MGRYGLGAFTAEYAGETKAKELVFSASLCELGGK
jgi:hypothetical protein